MIPARRVERSFGTARDRLVKEMRLEGIASLEGANRFLQDYWVPFWNERFTVEPADPRDAHRPLPADADLEALFAETERRVVARDFTIRFAKRRWQIPEREAGGIAPSAEVIVERRLDGDIRFRFGDRYLGLEPVRQAPAASPNDAPAKPAKPRPAPPKPAPDHPWRKHFQASAQPAISRRNLRREREGISNENERPRIPEATGAGAKTGTPGEDISIAV